MDTGGDANEDVVETLVQRSARLEAEQKAEFRAKIDRLVGCLGDYVDAIMHKGDVAGTRSALVDAVATVED